MLRLTSGGSLPESGMLAYLQVGAGSPPPSAGSGPAAVNDSYSVSKGAPLNDNVLSNDVGLGVATVVSNPKNGTLAFNTNGTFTYTPNAHFSGSDYFHVLRQRKRWWYSQQRGLGHAERVLRQ